MSKFYWIFIKNKPRIFWISLSFYIIAIFVGFTLHFFDLLPVEYCPTYDFDGPNFMSEDCEKKYELIVQVRMIFVLSTLGGCWLVSLGSLIRAFVRYKRDKIRAFFPAVINGLIGFAVIDSWEWWAPEFVLSGFMN